MTFISELYIIALVCKCGVLDGTLKLYSVSEDRQLHSCSPSSMVGLFNLVQFYWPTVLSVEPMVQYVVCLSVVRL